MTIVACVGDMIASRAQWEDSITTALCRFDADEVVCINSYLGIANAVLEIVQDANGFCYPIETDPDRYPSMWQKMDDFKIIERLDRSRTLDHEVALVVFHDFLYADKRIQEIMQEAQRRNIPVHHYDSYGDELPIKPVRATLENIEYFVKGTG